jgi:tetratricopeptide (TPR) repeat protein
MRSNNTQKVLSTLLIVYIVSFIGLLVYNLLDIHLYKNKEIIEIFRFGIALEKSLVLYLDYFLAIHTAAIIILYSVFYKPDVVKNTTEQFGSFISSSIITFIILSIIYLFLIIAFAPSVKYSLQGKININNTAVFFLDTANESFERENYESALKYYDLYLTIDGNNREINTLRQLADDKIFRRETDSTSSEITETEEMEEDNIEPFVLLNKARNFFDSKDYASAHYYADLSLKLDPDNNAASILSDLALELLYSYKPVNPNPDSYIFREKTYSFHELKVMGYTALQTPNFIEAFQIFKILAESSPENLEIINFYQESMEGLKTITFFYNEIEEINALPSINNIIFINHNEDIREMILIGQMFHIGTQVYFKNIEIIRLNNSGNITASMFSEYGKFINNYINLNYIKENEEIIFDENKMIELYIDINLLPYFSIEKDTISTISLNNLFSVKDLYDEAGYSKKDVELAFLIKIIHPCLFLILSLLCISIGWSYRARYLGRPPVITFLIMPVTPFVNAIIISLIIYFHRILLGFILATAGFVIALLALIIIEFVLFIISLLILSGQRME